MQLKYDIKINIATASSRKSTFWKNTELNYSSFLDKLSKTKLTNETLSEYLKMNKDLQSNIKDVGGFVGGTLKEGKRKNGYVLNRSLITLDIDFGLPSIFDLIKERLSKYSYAFYSTHKSSKTAPRLRLILPLDKYVSPEEYEAIARKIADMVGIELFDDSTYEPTRLMFWPSTPKDQEYIFKYNDAPILKANEILAMYPDWRDMSYWPRSERQEKIIKKDINLKLTDPSTKGGIIGAFCNAYSISEAISYFLSDVYLSYKGQKNRYTYINGSTSGGLVVYNDEFAYSNHSTDPCYGKDCNSFDLVRIHKFGDLDKGAKEKTPTNKLPSYQRMLEWAREDANVKYQLVDSIVSDIKLSDFDDDKEWLKQLEFDTKGNIRPTITNFKLILNNDPNLKGIGGLNLFTQRNEVLESLPWARVGKTWNDTDDANLREYIERTYHVESRQKIFDALSIIFTDHSFHPVKDYLEKLEWDGIPRCEYLLIDYLGASSSPYVKEVTLKTLVAAIKRIYEPGCKFDYMLTLVGRQGIGKSLLFKKLAEPWFSDTITDIQGKEAYEQLDGNWIIEMSELSALKKAEREQIKGFISKQNDTYRKAYARNVTDNPRQCIFIGTTNENEFLNDPTGNRRFWIVDVNEDLRTRTVWDDLNDEEKNQIWAEAYELYLSGKFNINSLSESIRNEAKEIQEAHMQTDPWQGKIEEFLKIRLPNDWDNKDMYSKQVWISQFARDIDTQHRCTKVRTTITPVEIWVECFENNINSMKQLDSRRITECLSKINGWERTNKRKRFGDYGLSRYFIKED